MEMERVIEFPHADMDRRPRKRPRLDWDVAPQALKGNSTAAAFENKDNGQLLWINESTPEWIQKKFECLTFDPKIAPKSHKSVSDIKDDGDPVSNSWRNLVRNPKNWKDHRKNKLNNLLKPKHPDFKHKDSGVPLWLNTAPKWVLSGLDGLEFDVPLLNVKQAKGSKDGQYESIVQALQQKEKYVHLCGQIEDDKIESSNTIADEDYVEDDTICSLRASPVGEDKIESLTYTVSEQLHRRYSFTHCRRR
ncbi:hypothetical protein LOK49_LG03G01776 [Camellia lanceoleosa]|uniref:Uncharacterized protein n=1 Tax=Camellia lanceoleosa TaxID=1840588 RepID=A0ACC0I961_9ERIC|nr:hypothetical protein LOK49_LG03G01776 [Camellia lanceoleosa]